ncbi:MAG TPA: glycosyltransferase family 4 protein [Polyangiaceae bacterium]|nr:glycosyltransferase family 4 protein [Polyangiaceae bacterium]
MNTLDVLHVYSGNLFGGVERMLISLAKMDGAEWRSHFALCFEGGLSRALELQGTPASQLGSVRLRNPLSALRARGALRRLLAKHDFSAVVCHGIWTFCIFGPVIARGELAPILYLHDVPDPKGPFYRWAWRKPPALCIANSSMTASSLAEMQARVPVRVVHPLVPPPPPIDRATVGQLRATLGAAREDVVILQASRFDSWKGHRNLLQGLAAIRDLPRWRCWIAGAPQRPEEEAYKRELVTMAGALGLEQRVSFIGHRNDMETVLAACDVYCQPNETPEAFGMVFIEALYAGKPVVARALGGALEIVTPECGILCRAGADALSAALRTALSDCEFRKRVAVVGPERAAALSGPERFRLEFRAALETAAVRGRSH